MGSIANFQLNFLAKGLNGFPMSLSKISPTNPKFDRCENMFTLLDSGPQIQNFVIPISTIFIYQNRSISIFPNFGEGDN
jgi:hypothetical protein